MQNFFIHDCFLKKILFIFGCVWSLLLCVDSSLVAASGGYSSLWCVGFSLRWLLLLWSTGSRRVGFSSCGSRALERRLSTCGAWAQLPRGMWDLPGPGIEHAPPALAGGFLTTVPPGKSLEFFFNRQHFKKNVDNLEWFQNKPVS